MGLLVELAAPWVWVPCLTRPARRYLAVWYLRTNSKVASTFNPKSSTGYIGGKREKKNAQENWNEEKKKIPRNTALSRPPLPSGHLVAASRLVSRVFPAPLCISVQSRGPMAESATCSLLVPAISPRTMGIITPHCTDTCWHGLGLAGFCGLLVCGGCRMQESQHTRVSQSWFGSFWSGLVWSV